MPDKIYNFKGKETTITGTDDLLKFLDDVFGEYDNLSNQPSLEEQLALFDKAKPYLQQAKVQIDYKSAPIDVMKNALIAGNISIEDASDETIRYLFNKVLPVHTPETPENKENKGSTPKPSGVKPVSTAGGGMSSEDLANTIQKARLEGSVK